MANMRMLMYKLQTALMQRGRMVYIGQFQNYSEKAGRMVTKIVLSEKNNKGRMVRIFESWNTHEVVQFLAAQLNGGDG